MHLHPRLVVIALLATAPALAATPPATGPDAGPDEAWQVTATMHMTRPMAMTMPAVTRTTCVPPGSDQRPPDLRGADCKLTHFEHQGKRTSYAAVCQMQGGGEVTGKGWVDKSDATHYTGRMDLNGTGGGMPMAMHVEYSGTRTGSCTAASK